ncbi:LytR C-terminal domain-containing protein [Candidatus Curtissbacteria bacterium]|nr:LytR C-terminal domain-containing protein [Candidatus Curtissbacteria bacterium]
MTGYPAHRLAFGQAWRRREAKKKWKNFLAAFIVIVLLFATANGIIRTFSLRRYFGESQWDSQSSFISTLNTSPPSVLVFQKDPKRLAVFKLSENAYFATGNPEETLTRFSDIIELGDGNEAARVLSLALGAKVESFLFFKGKVNVERASVENLFKNFASPVTPIKIFNKNNFSNLQSSNITQVDMFKLWWQVKSLSIEKLEIIDFGDFVENIVLSNNQKVLGVDDAALHLKISAYLESKKLLEEGSGVEIQNASGVAQSGNLAAEFASVVGFNVVAVGSVGDFQQETKIFSKNQKSYQARYLANIFDCDIVGPRRSPQVNGEASGSGEVNDEKILVVIGRDFALRYFQ